MTRYYTIVYYEGEKEIGRERWTGTFSGAKNLAARAVEGGAGTRTRILDDVGRAVFQYPKIMRSALAVDSRH